MIKLGYFVPEFPGQTHIFFWREMKALKKLGVEVEVVSTQQPERAIICHAWSEEAIRATTYLFPIDGSSLLNAIGRVLGAGPSRISKCLGVIARADGASLKHRLRMFALIIMGGHIANLAKSRGWKHVHVHSCADAAYIGLFAKILADVPYSLTLHGPLSYFGPSQRDKWFGVEFGIIITERIRTEFLETFPDFPPDRIEIAPMGVDLEVLTRSQPYTPWTVADGTVRTISCGRLHPAKGHQEVIRAVALLRDAGIRMHLTILGEGPYRPQLEALIAELKVQDDVTLMGAVAEEVVREQLEDAHIFILASHEEPLGVAIMEAMAMGMPVLSTNAGGVPELVRSGVDGYLVAPRAPQEIVDAVQRIIADPDMASRFGANGRARVEEKFSAEVSARVIARRSGAI